MEAEPEMFGAALAAAEGSAHGSFVLPATQLERHTWLSVIGEAATGEDLDRPGQIREGRQGLSSVAGRAVVGTIAIAQLLWWAMLAYTLLRLAL
jgi:hypothetical protein